jgi:hypothetical protein
MNVSRSQPGTGPRSYPPARGAVPARAHGRTPDADVAPSRRSTALTPAAVARAGVLGFVLLVALEHPLRPDLPATRHFVSEYASGSTDVIARAAFLVWGVGIAALAVGLWRARARITALLVGVAAAGTPLAAAFATVTVGGELPVGGTYTTGGRLHDLGASMLFFGLLLAAAASLRPLRRRATAGASPAWRRACCSRPPCWSRSGATGPASGSGPSSSSAAAGCCSPRRRPGASPRVADEHRLRGEATPKASSTPAAISRARATSWAVVPPPRL